jgi:hypothetical protein
MIFLSGGILAKWRNYFERVIGFLNQNNGISILVASASTLVSTIA